MTLSINTIQASVRGNKPNQIPNQDHIAIFENDIHLIVSVADGLGSSLHSLEGARIACECVINAAQNWKIDQQLSELDLMIRKNWDNIIAQKDEGFKNYRTTSSFITVFKKDKKILIGQLGDIWVSIQTDGLFQQLCSSDKDFLNETECLGSGRDQKFKICMLEFLQSFNFLLATDGIGDELNIVTIEALHNFFINKFEDIESLNRNNILEKDIVQFINEKNNDDKSLVFTWANKN